MVARDNLSTSQGVALSLVASMLFGAMYFYSSLLSPLSGEEMFGWRILFMVPALAVWIKWRGQWSDIQDLIKHAWCQPIFLLGLLASAALLGLQLWLFMWAPLHGHALDVALGYFLLPLSLLVIGCMVWRERLSRWQQWAALCAVLGVAHEIYRAEYFSWPIWIVVLGYPLYFMLRRRLGTEHLGGLWIDFLLAVPMALWFVIHGSLSLDVLAKQPSLYGLIAGLGVLGILAVLCYFLASYCLPLSLFGLLGYVEPLLLMGVALLLGESVEPHKWLTYIPIWIAVVLLISEGILAKSGCLAQ